MRRSRLFVARRSLVVLLLSMATGTGCVIGPLEQSGTLPPPGQDLVTDLARATRQVTGAIHGVQHLEDIPPREDIPPPPPIPPTTNRIPPSQAMVATSQPCPATEPQQIPAGAAPILEPPPGPPPRFFPLPTQPVFTGATCEPWKMTF